MDFFKNQNIKSGSDNFSLLGGQVEGVSDVITQSDTQVTIDRIIPYLSIDLRSYYIHVIEFHSSCT